MIPLSLRIKKTAHRDIAIAQDLIMMELYNVLGDAVLHGGTGIWRCYHGNRFSDDIDVYIKRDLDKINSLFSNLEKKGFIIEKKKIGDNSLYSNLRFNRTSVRFEAVFKVANGTLKDYETTDGNFITVLTLKPEELIIEKVETYLKRQKIRDLYDIFFLLRPVRDKTKVKEPLRKLILNYKPPVDEQDLKLIILEGLVPKTEKMLDYIKGYYG